MPERVLDAAVRRREEEEEGGVGGACLRDGRRGNREHVLPSDENECAHLAACPPALVGAAPVFLRLSGVSVGASRSPTWRRRLEGASAGSSLLTMCLAAFVARVAAADMLAKCP